MCEYLLKNVYIYVTNSKKNKYNRDMLAKRDKRNV